MASVEVKNGSASSAQTIVVTGANRGIGLGIVQTLAKNKHFRVIATARDTKKATELNAVAKSFPNVSVVELDVSDAKSTAGLAERLGAAKVTAVDVLINNAGVTRNNLSLDGTEWADFEFVFRTNVVGVWAVTQALLPLLRKAPSKHARVINVSSYVGSIEGTINGALPPLFAPYRVSKTALNELTAIQAREFNSDATAAPITVIAAHPGMVDTDMAAQVLPTLLKAFPANAIPKPITSAESGDALVKIALEAKPERKAQFLNVDGKPLPW